MLKQERLVGSVCILFTKALLEVEKLSFTAMSRCEDGKMLHDGEEAFGEDLQRGLGVDKEGGGRLELWRRQLKMRRECRI